MLAAGRALATLLALLAATHARKPTMCENAVVGSTREISFQQDDVILAAGKRVYNINFSNGKSPCPSGAMHVGTRMKACDWTAPPVVSVVSMSSAIFTRTSNVNESAVVHWTAYCKLVPYPSYTHNGSQNATDTQPKLTLRFWARNRIVIGR